MQLSKFLDVHRFFPAPRSSLYSNRPQHKKVIMAFPPFFLFYSPLYAAFVAELTILEENS